MRAMHWSYDDLQRLPVSYLPVLVDLLMEAANEADGD